MGDSVHHTDCFLEHMVFYQTTCVTQMLCPAKSERQYKVLSPAFWLLFWKLIFSRNTFCRLSLFQGMGTVGLWVVGVLNSSGSTPRELLIHNLAKMPIFCSIRTGRPVDGPITLRAFLPCRGGRKHSSQSSHRRVYENGTCSFKLKDRSPTTLLLLLITREPKNVKFRKSRLAASASSVTAYDEAKLKKAYLLRGEARASKKTCEIFIF
ncbi:hypothetical protein VNO77_46333 [Canavalia gladiata]|uniref:Uncharacterized protein n=1 Tax=Canavalia gladiata TaxID=3824 RepID=A0AAN9JJT5_CANGL